MRNCVSSSCFAATVAPTSGAETNWVECAIQQQTSARNLTENLAMREFLLRSPRATCHGLDSESSLCVSDGITVDCCCLRGATDQSDAFFFCAFCLFTVVLLRSLHSISPLVGLSGSLCCQDFACSQPLNQSMLVLCVLLILSFP